VAYEYVSTNRRQEIMFDAAAGEDTRLTYRVLAGRPPKETIATSATITLFTSTGTTIKTATAMTIEGSPSPVVYYDVATSTIGATTIALGEAFQAKLTISHADGKFHDRIFFDVVRNPLRITLSDDLLTSYESDLAQFKAPDQTDWSRKCGLAVDYVHRRLRQQMNQDGNARPALLIGSDQVIHWSALYAVESILRDQEGRETDREVYTALREQEEALVLSNLAYSVSDAIDPGDPAPTNFSGFRITK